MRPAIATLTLLGLVAGAAAYSFAGTRILSTQTASEQEFVLEAPSLDEMEGFDDAGEAAAAPRAAIRPVAPDSFAPPLVEHGDLLRIEERQPLSPIGRAPDPRDLPPAPTTLHGPVASAAGAFEARGHKVALAGIEVTAADETCGSGAAAWPCGVHARTAFRNWLRGRALACTVKPVPVSETVVTDCRVGNADPAEWLVAQGWARATPGGPYAALQAEAERERRGLFGLAPSSSTPVVSPAPAVPEGG